MPNDFHPGQFAEEERSDLFSVKKYTSDSKIPKIEKVPLTKEERRRRLVIRIIWALTALAIAGFATWLTLFLIHRARVANALEEASTSGRIAAIDHALGVLEGDDDDQSRAIKLRLRAMLVLAGDGRDDQATLTQELERLPGGEVQNRAIAQTYLSLARGDLAAAREHASAIVVSGDAKAEAARARALAARSVGNVEQAMLEARLAAEALPESPRHVSLLAELMARSGDHEAAIAMLDDLDAERRNAATRIARARILDQSGAQIDLVGQHAQAVLDDGEATPHEQAWARLLLARAAAVAGNRVVAREHLDQAAQVAPAGDELFTLGLAEGALRIEALALARTATERLPSPLSVDAGRRAQLTAELALASHDLRTATQALASAPSDPRTALARGRLLEARGDFDAAAQQYRAANQSPGLQVPASVRLASLALARGEPREAVELMTPLLAEQRTHPDVVPVAVEARLGIDEPARAMELVQPALQEHPNDVRLLEARAHVQMAQDQWEAALATLDRAIGIVSDDADLHADRGRAAERLERSELAATAYDRALTLSEHHPVAVLGRIRLHVAAIEPGEALTLLERADEAEIESLELEQLRCRALVMNIAGQSAVRTVRQALRSHRRDATLNICLAWLHAQADHYSTAFRTLTRYEDDDPDAFLSRVIVQVRMRAANPARSAMESFMERVDEDDLPPPTRARLHATLARLALADDNNRLARREATRAIELDEHASEAHMVLAELTQGARRQQSYERALRARFPSVEPLAILALADEDEVTTVTCGYARRYRNANPAGPLIRPIRTMLRDCRALPGQTD